MDAQQANMEKRIKEARLQKEIEAKKFQRWAIVVALIFIVACSLAVYANWLHVDRNKPTPTLDPSLFEYDEPQLWQAYGEDGEFLTEVYAFSKMDAGYKITAKLDKIDNVVLYTAYLSWKNGGYVTVRVAP